MAPCQGSCCDQRAPASCDKRSTPVYNEDISKKSENKTMKKEQEGGKCCSGNRSCSSDNDPTVEQPSTTLHYGDESPSPQQDLPDSDDCCSNIRQSNTILDSCCNKSPINSGDEPPDSDACCGNISSPEKTVVSCTANEGASTNADCCSESRKTESCGKSDEEAKHQDLAAESSNMKRCCGAETGCSCSDECIVEYANYLCSLDNKCKAGDNASCHTKGVQVSGRCDSMQSDILSSPSMTATSFPNNGPLQQKRENPKITSSDSCSTGSCRPNNADALRQRKKIDPCSRHLKAASASARADSCNSKVLSSQPKADRSISDIINITRRCFCRGPGRFLFPGQMTCCSVRQERLASAVVEQRQTQSSSCSPELKSKTIDTIEVSDIPRDIEKGDTSAVFAATLGVIGMTCTGCESKLYNLLASEPGIQDVRTSFMLNRADISYNSNTISDLSHLIGKIKKQTGFTCTVLKTSLLAAGSTGESVHVAGLEQISLAKVMKLDGIDQVVPTGKGVHELFYDPQLVGIRDILHIANGTGDSVELVTDQTAEELSRKAEDRHWYYMIARLIVSTAFTIPILIFAWSSFVHRSTASDQLHYSAASFALATVVQALAIPIYKHSLQSLLYQREIDMDTLVSLSITSSYIYSVAAFGFQIRDGETSSMLGRPIFETSGLLITLITFGRIMALWVRRKAKNAIKLGIPQPTIARIISANDTTGKVLQSREGSEMSLDVALLHYGDHIRGERSDYIVTDGVVVDGVAEVDESHITGENDPVVHTKKSPVFAGSKIINGSINYRVTRLVSENTISAITRLVTTGASSRTKIQEKADLVASYLTPTILAIACIIFLIWALINIFVRHWASSTACVSALTFAISVLSISCPCALALAVPMVLASASHSGAKRGVLFKSGSSLEAGPKVKHFVFDKTGTLTTGELSIVSERLLPNASGFPDNEIRQIVVTLTNDSKHPVSEAIRRSLVNDRGLEGLATTGQKPHVIVGKGVEITINNTRLRGGSPTWLNVEHHDAVKDLISSSLTVFCACKEDTLIASYGLTSTIRPEALDVLQNLKAMGIAPHLLSGDNPMAVQRVADGLGFRAEHVQSMCQPDSKAAYVRNLQKETSAKILFIGDGTNDAPALAQADIGVCMSNATDIAADSADVGILSGSLNGLLVFMELSKSSTKRIWLNISWALLYNFFTVLFAGGAFEAVHFRIPPSYAGLGEVVSLVPIIIVSLSLRWI